MKISGFKDTIEWYNQNARQYTDTVDGMSFKDDVSNFLTYLPEQPTVLDAGCGSGRDTGVFHELGADVTGVDLSTGLLAVAREKFPTIDFIEGSFVELPFADEMFDGVWAHASLVHLEEIADVVQALNEFNRVLKPGGWLYVYVKQQTSEEETAIVTDTLSGHDRFFRYYTPENLLALLTQSGFAPADPIFVADVHGRSEVRWLKYIVQK